MANTMYLLQNVTLYSPQFEGKKDVLIGGEQILKIADRIEVPEGFCTCIDLEGQNVVPGLIDGHVHVTGGGGEGSFHTRVPEIQLSKLVEAGITTVVGLLGTDSITRSVENLLAKTKALKSEGLSAYMLTGAYRCPTDTLTDDVQKDIAFIEEIIGVKIALSDHRSSNPSQQYFNQLASNVRTAGMIGGKAGIVTIHMGDDPHGLEMIRTLFEETSVPKANIIPTHVGRNEQLLAESLDYLQNGGRIDLTCGGVDETLRAGKVAAKICREGTGCERVTISSDANGSWSQYDDEGNLLKIGASDCYALLEELRYLVQEEELSLPQVLQFFTENVAKGLKLYPKKGCLKEKSDADLLVFDDQMQLQYVFCRGKMMMDRGEVIVRGCFE